MESNSNNKIQALRGVMKNESLYKVLRDAVNAPLGSTTREKAKHILNIIKKTKMDGKGGVNFTATPKEPLQLTPKEQDYSRIVVFPPTPNPRGFDKPQNAVSTPPIYKSNVAFSPDNFSNLLKTLPVTTAKSTPPVIDHNMFESAPVQENVPPVDSNAFTPVPKQQINVQQQQQQNVQQQDEGAGYIPPGAPIPGEDAPTVTQQVTQQGVQGSTEQQMPIAPEGQMSMQQATEQNQPVANPIQEAVNQGIGADAFAMQSLAKGPDFLKSLPGFENMPESALSDGPTLTGRISQLEKALRSEYKLNETLNELTNLANQGASLEGRLQDYIRGRDEFLNETDQMLENLKKKTLTMDLSDPRNRKAVNDHMNYLYELRGRQNKRYAEFVKSSIDQYNQRLNALQNIYTNTLNQYARELQTRSDITKEEYGMIFDALKNMYNTVNEAPKRALELSKLQAEVAKNEANAIKDIIGKQSLGSDSYVTTYKNLKEVGAIDKEGNWIPNNYSSLAVDNPAMFLTVMLDAGEKALNTPNKDGMYKSPEEIRSIASNIMGHIRNLEASGYLDNIGAESAILSVKNSMKKALKNSGLISTEDAQIIRKAVERISGDNNWFWGFKGKAPTREEFIAEFSDTGVPLEILNTIYSDYENNFSEENRSEFAGYLTDRDGNPLPDDKLIDIVLDSYISKLQPAPTTTQVNPNGNNGISMNNATRAVRNNNPLNIKYSEATANYDGVVGVDPKPADDSGQFLVFATPEAGFNAAKRLLKTPSYSDLTVDQALYRWSGGGYDGEKVAPQIAQKKVNELTDEELDALVKEMAKWEGYYQQA